MILRIDVLAEGPGVSLGLSQIYFDFVLKKKKKIKKNYK